MKRPHLKVANLQIVRFTSPQLIFVRYPSEKNIGLFLTRELKSSHFHKYNLDSLGFLKFKIVYGGKVEVSSDSFPPTRRRKMPCHLMFFERHQDGMQEQ